MEQTRKDTVIEVLCRAPSCTIIRVFKYPGGRYTTSPRKVHQGPSGTPMSILARKRGVHLPTVSRFIKKDLGYKSYALKVRHLLTDAQKAKRSRRKEFSCL
ncbi:Uncharacterized protein FKW44_012068 [Caligus rogercresseyi]|uniref:Uncharacterized protein n=1 Tax=Caligus rogercresseyi TaxID=217165 RepID=A0A7T8HK41_CALRO|nr:Uncharacterized protein FKW44_012068 [Caligus rogercresseyi]